MPHDVDTREHGGAPSSTTSIKASIAACHSGSAASFHGRPVNVVGGIPEGQERLALRQRDWMVKLPLPTPFCSHRAYRSGPLPRLSN
jgi:hypothetical protein